MDQLQVLEVGKPFYLKLKNGGQGRQVDATKAGRKFYESKVELFNNRDLRSTSRLPTKDGSLDELKGRLSRVARSLHQSTEDLYNSREFSSSKVASVDDLEDLKGRISRKLSYQSAYENVQKSSGEVGKSQPTRSGSGRASRFVQKFSNMLKNSCKLEANSVAMDVDFTAMHSVNQDYNQKFVNSPSVPITKVWDRKSGQRQKDGQNGEGGRSALGSSALSYAVQNSSAAGSVETPKQNLDAFQKSDVSPESVLVVVRLNPGKELWMSAAPDVSASGKAKSSPRGPSIRNLREEPWRNCDYRSLSRLEAAARMDNLPSDGGDSVTWQPSSQRRLPPSRFQREHLEGVRNSPTV